MAWYHKSGEQIAFERYLCRVLIDKEQKQLLLNPRTYKQTHTPTVVQGGGKEFRTILR